MNKALNYLALARKAGKAELGEEPVGAATRAGKAPLVLVASDASDHTWRRALSFVAGTDQQCLRITATKDEMGQAIGRSALAIAAIIDPAMALALAKALPETEKVTAAVAALAQRAEKVRQRQKEAKAHEKNKALGKRRQAPAKH